MYQTQRRWSFVLLSVLCAAALAPAAYAGSPADWAPEDTDILIEVPDFKALRGQVEKTLFYKLFQDEQVKKLMAEPLKEMEEEMDKAARELGFEGRDALMVWPEGPMAFIMQLGAPPTDGSEPEPRVGVVGDWGSNTDKLKELLNRATAKVLDDGGKKDNRDFQGVTLTTVTPKRETAEGEVRHSDGPESMTFAHIDKLTVVGSDDKLVEQLVRRVKSPGGAESVSGLEDYKSLARHCQPLGQVHVYVNYQRIMEFASSVDREAAEMNKAFGLTSMRGVVGTFDFATKKGAALESRFFQPVKGEARGIMKIMRDHTADMQLSGSHGFPKGTVVAWWLNLNMEKMVDEVYEMVKAVDPEEAESFKENLKTQAADGTTVDLGEVFRSFSKPLKLYWSMTAPYERDNVSIVLSLGHKNREVIGKIFDIIGPMLLKRDLMGQSIYEVAMMPVGAALALTDAAFAVGSTPGIEALVRSTNEPSEGLSADAQFRKSAQLAPDKAFQYFYADLVAVFDAAYSLHQKAKAAGEAEPETFSMDMTDGLLGGLKDIPFDAVENPAGLRQYLFSILSVSNKNSDGFLSYFNVMPPVAGN